MNANNDRKPIKPYRVEGGWCCETWNKDGKLVQIFVPDKED